MFLCLGMIQLGETLNSKNPANTCVSKSVLVSTLSQLSLDGWIGGLGIRKDTLRKPNMKPGGTPLEDHVPQTGALLTVPWEGISCSTQMGRYPLANHSLRASC